jgi:hypothetical protein
MNPQITRITDVGDDLVWTLQGVSHSFANAIRRTILSQIDRLVIDNIVIEENTSAQFHNEILKERIRAVPVYLALDDEAMHQFAQTHVLELDLTNQTNEKIYATTEHFVVRNTTTGKVLDPTELKTLFRPYQSFYYIDLMRLLPGKGESIQGERIRLKAQFGVCRAEENSCYSVVSKCAFHNTVDEVRAKEALHELEEKLRAEGVAPEIISVRRRDFDALDKYRIFLPNSFDFVVRSIGIYDNRDLVVRACKVLQRRFEKLKTDIGKDEVMIQPANHVGSHPPSSMEHALDVVLKPGNTGGRIQGLMGPEDLNESLDFHSVGYLLDHLLFQDLVEQKAAAAYVGYAKFHPHSKEGVIRVAFRRGEGIDAQLKQAIIQACNQAQQVFTKVQQGFADNRPMEKPASA